MLTTKNSGLVTSQPAQEAKVMKVKILRNTVANKKAVNEGAIVEVSEIEGKFLVSIGKAVEIARPEAPSAPSMETTDAEPPAMESTAKAQPKPRNKK